MFSLAFSMIPLPLPSWPFATIHPERSTDMHAITWFELPATDLDRAAAFYGTVLGAPLRRDVFAGIPHAFFPMDGAKDGVGGALILDKTRKPSSTGTLVYVNVKNEQGLEAALGRVKGAGGKIVLEKTSIGPMGWIAIIEDTEGNHAGLHGENG